MRWPWPESSDPEPEQPREEAEEKRSEKSRLRRGVEYAAAWAGIVGAVYLIVPLVANALHSDDPIKLEVGEVAVHNPPAQFASYAGGTTVQTDDSKPKITATVRNRGEETAWIEEARITVLAGARLETCLRQGDVPHSKEYPVSLPEFPNGERRVLRRDLHVEVQPGHGVRPLLSLERSGFASTNLYAIRVELVADPGGRVLDLGRFVVGVPEPPERYGLMLPESDDVLNSPAMTPDSPVITWCFRHNAAAMRRITAEPGKRVEAIRALDRFRFASSWREFGDRRRAPAVIADLLRSDQPEGMLYAVEAAEGTRDAELAADVKARAVGLLLEHGREALDASPALAVADAERVLSLEASADARDLLQRARDAIAAESEP